MPSEGDARPGLHFEAERAKDRLELRGVARLEPRLGVRDDALLVEDKRGAPRAFRLLVGDIVEAGNGEVLVAGELEGEAPEAFRKLR